MPGATAELQQFLQAPIEKKPVARAKTAELRQSGVEI
jgi:hypothetical protein